jgi:hypothetical protein
MKDGKRREKMVLLLFKYRMQRTKQISSYEIEKKMTTLEQPKLDQAMKLDPRLKIHSRSKNVQQKK